MATAEQLASYATFREIVDQPRAWQATLQTMRRTAEVLGEQQGLAGQGTLVWTGCGSPYFLAQSAAAVFRALGGGQSAALPASELALYPGSLAREQHRALIAVSRSGATSEVLKAVSTARARCSDTVVAITCAPESPLAHDATLTIGLPDAQEHSWAQTRSFTSMLLAAQCLSYTLAGQTPGDTYWGLPELGATLLDQQLELALELGSDSRFDHFVFLGGGPLYGLACEAMLKMKEMSLSVSEAFHVLEYRHGPMSMITERSLVVGFLSEAALPHELVVLEEMHALGATTLALTPTRLAPAAVDHQVLLPAGLSDFERGALYLPVPQLLACARAVNKGLDPDRPANLVPFVTLELDATSRHLEA